MRQFLAIGGVSGFLAVACGAFGAHALRDRLSPEMLAVWETGAHYHLVHSVALLIVALLAERIGGKWVSAAGWLFTAGVVLFAGTCTRLR